MKITGLSQSIVECSSSEFGDHLLATITADIFLTSQKDNRFLESKMKYAFVAHKPDLKVILVWPGQNERSEFGSFNITFYKCSWNTSCTYFVSFHTNALPGMTLISNISILKVF